MLNDNIRSIILSRRSIRRYQSDRPVPREVLEGILAAATWAPSAHNRQPWRFVAITTPNIRQDLALAMGARLRTDLKADNVPSEVIEKDVSRSYSRITGAAALVLACMTMADMDRYPDTKRASAERLMAVQSTSLAVQNLLLAAHAEGLGACWMCAPLFCPDVVSAQLDLPADWEPQALITLGYPAEHKQSTRQPLETRVLWR
jgi:coenzyme F420-0:L-glutamate ligase / coenzyme F420-1:gamma-L-glutamate ligase